MRTWECGYCHKVLENGNWMERKDTLSSCEEVYFIVCPSCFSKRGEADFWRRFNKLEDKK